MQLASEPDGIGLALSASEPAWCFFSPLLPCSSLSLPPPPPPPPPAFLFSVPFRRDTSVKTKVCPDGISANSCAVKGSPVEYARACGRYSSWNLCLARSCSFSYVSGIFCLGPRVSRSPNSVLYCKQTLRLLPGWLAQGLVAVNSMKIALIMSFVIFMYSRWLTSRLARFSAVCQSSTSSSSYSCHSSLLLPGHALLRLRKRFSITLSWTCRMSPVVRS